MYPLFAARSGVRGCAPNHLHCVTLALLEIIFHDLSILFLWVLKMGSRQVSHILELMKFSVSKSFTSKISTGKRRVCANPFLDEICASRWLSRPKKHSQLLPFDFWMHKIGEGREQTAQQCPRKEAANVDWLRSNFYLQNQHLCELSLLSKILTFSLNQEGELWWVPPLFICWR